MKYRDKALKTYENQQGAIKPYLASLAILGAGTVLGKKLKIK